ncbi:MAG: histidine phosphatase family protein [Planctomycetes bacterium]|nr:histidine phosphatase family protein [Planctomycetota bacterium]
MPTPSPATGRSGGPRAEVWLLRHPEVRADWSGRAYGNLDVPLSEQGLLAAREVGAWYGGLGCAGVVSSPLVRARTLAEAVASAAGLPLELEPALRELDRGRWQGRERAELERDESAAVRAYHADPWGFRGHAGETDADLHARAWPVLERAALRARAHPVVLVTHYNVARVLAAAALGIPPARSFALRLDPARGILLARSTHGWALSRANVVDPRPLAAPL